MGENEKNSKAPTSILDQILDETYQKMENIEDFDSELISKLKKVQLPGNTSTEQKLISILRGESP